MTLGTRSAACSIVPPYLIERLGLLADADLDRRIRTARARGGPTPPPGTAVAATPTWTIHTAEQSTDLPGRAVRSAGRPATGDEAVDEAALGISGALALFAEVYDRASYDDHGAPVSVTVHYGRDYPNAFWDGTRLVFGDGDGEVFGRFTRPLDVLAHELTHAVVEHSAGLVYRDQPGALNESLCDVFASCFKQRVAGQVAADGDWLIGAELFLPGVAARGLRDLRSPGTAYDDPRLGRDPQPAHLDAYVTWPDDNGGVHVNSGIPNRAFHLAALAVGGTSWDGAGRIWYDALVGGGVGPTTDFAWDQVGVRVADPGRERPRPSAVAAGPVAPASRTVRVRRTGGFAGTTTEASVDLDRAAGDDELATLVAQVGGSGLPTSSPVPRPDMFCYDVDLCGARARVPEQLLTPGVRRIIELVLEAGTGR